MFITVDTDQGPTTVEVAYTQLVDDESVLRRAPSPAVLLLPMEPAIDPPMRCRWCGCADDTLIRGLCEPCTGAE